MKDVLSSYFEFASVIEGLKKLERFRGQFYWRDYPQLKRYESVADHTWRLSILLILFENKLSQKFDLTKALKMALIHDLPEILAGDDSPLGEDGTGKHTHAFNQHVAHKRSVKEQQAAKELFGMLSDTKAQELLSLWQEFEDQQAFEARVIKSLDRIEALLQVLQYRGGHLFPGHLEFNITYGLKGSDVDPAVHKFGQLIAQKMRDQYREFKK